MHQVGDIALRYVLHPIPRYVLAWVLALSTAGYAMYEAWFNFRDVRRADGNGGHTAIDFGGQWCMGRMLATGNGRHLYNRNYHMVILQASYPREYEVPLEKRSKDESQRHDAEPLLWCFMGRNEPEVLASVVTPLAANDPLQLLTLNASAQDQCPPDRLEKAARAVGGPLYPPINALLYYPLGLLPPQASYRCMQVLNLILAFGAGWGVRQIARGRIWWPIAVTVILIFPGFSGSINLGQNATLTLAILVWGWYFTSRGKDGWGGLVWGLLAFKPVWALAFFLILLMTRRWRFAASMVGCSAVLALATLPFVGIQGWLDWLQVGKEAAILYNIDKNWIFLSRDILSIPRRWLIDFDVSKGPVQDNPVAHWIGWPMLLTIFGLTLLMAVIRWKQARAATGPVAAFLLLGGWLSCYHFMYYDVLLASLPIFLLFTEPRRYLEPSLVAITRVSAEEDGFARYYQPDLASNYPWPPPILIPRLSGIWVLNRFEPTLFVALLITKFTLPEIGRRFFPGSGFGEIYGTPWDTFCLIALWMWCGWLWLRLPRTAVIPAASVDRDKTTLLSGDSHAAPLVKSVVGEST